MKLTTGELEKILTILEKIDQGLASPQVPGHVGRYLRQYGRGRAQLDQILVEHGLERRADAAVSGDAVGAIEVYPLLDPKVSVRKIRYGEVAETIAISEELGGLTNVVMWLKGFVANAAYDVLRQNAGLRLAGDYRWTPPARLTPGEAHLEPVEKSVIWQGARCLKAVADDLDRPPHALEYVLDYRLGPPGLKYFRAVCAFGGGREWRVLPGLGQSRPLAVEHTLPQVRSALQAGKLVTLLIYREPWSAAWTIVGAEAIDTDEALTHAITWADFQRELDGSDTDWTIIAGVRESFHASGLRAAELREPKLIRSLLPVTRDVLRWLRGFA